MLLLLLLGLGLLLLGNGLLSLRLSQRSRTLASSERSKGTILVDVFVVAGSSRGKTGSTGLGGSAQEVVQTTLSLVSLLRLLTELVVIETVQVGTVIIATCRSVCLVGNVGGLSSRHGRWLVDGLTEHGTSGSGGRSLVGCPSWLTHRVVPLVGSGGSVCQEGNAH